jgi:molecular chaperone GrpE
MKDDNNQTHNPLDEEYEGKNDPLDADIPGTPGTDPDDDYEDDVTFEQDDTTRENNRPDAMARIAKLKIEIERLKAEKDKLLDNWQRDKAEFVNARKRDQDERNDFIKFANVGFIEGLLPVIDSFEAAMKHAGEGKEGGNGEKTSGPHAHAGLDHIYNQFKATLRRLGAEEFGEIGDAFDPAHHQAIANIETDDKKLDHTVAEVFQKGYSVHGKVVRPAFVKVFQV